MTDPIKHVVVLTLENHSFDQMLGCMKELYPELEGVTPGANQNTGRDGTVYVQQMTKERQMPFDPHHEVEHVREQLEGGNGGFVKNFSKMYPDSKSEDRQFVMGYYPLNFLPGLHQLAQHFTICDHWFSSLPGPTWPNRFMALTGTSKGRVNMPGDGTNKVDLAGYFQQDQHIRSTDRESHLLEVLFPRYSSKLGPQSSAIVPQCGALLLYGRVFRRRAGVKQTFRNSASSNRTSWESLGTTIIPLMT